MRNADACCGSIIKLVAGPGLSGSEAWGQWRSAGEWAAWFAKPSNYCRLPVEYQLSVEPGMAAGYADVPTGFVGRMRVSLLSVLNSLAPISSCELRWLGAQSGNAAYTVSAMMLWGRAMTKAGLHAIACRACSANMAAWVDDGIVEAEQISRRACAAEGGSLGSHVLLARLKTLLGRDLRGHDRLEEVEARTTQGHAHSYGRSGDFASDAAWRRDLGGALRSMLSNALQANTIAVDQSQDKWAATRGLWVPTGTSSMQREHVAGPNKHFMEAASAVGWPVSKKAVWTDRRLDLDALLQTKPRIEARGATKNEPGLKRRPLRAADDTSYLIAAYASAGLEKTYTENGAVMRQRPSDVQETTRSISNCRGPYILCIDYSDFNMTHQVSSRALVSAIMADIYRKKQMHKTAAAAEWMAAAHFNHFVDGKRVLRGLSSGERDTARDNTILHTAYAMLATRALGQIGREFERAFFRCCGDDEIAVGLNWHTAVSYALELAEQGHQLQPRKMMLSRDCGEFLQYNMFTDGRLPTQPLCPALINAVSGSWYKTARYDPASVPEQAADAFGGLARRGLDLNVCRKLTISCCHWLARDVPWRAMLNAHHLFSTRDTKPAFKTNVDAAEVRRHVPVATRGATDYAEWLERRFPGMINEFASRGSVHDMVDVGCFGAAAAALRGTAVPESEGFVDDVRVVHSDVSVDMQARNNCCRSWLVADIGSRVGVKEQLAFLSGLPASAFEGGKARQVLKKLGNTERAVFNAEEPRKLRWPKPMMHIIPGAMLAAFEGC